MLQKYWLSLLLLLFPMIVFAQAGKIRGTVVDTKSKEPLIGANIVVEGTNLGASTDADGSFLILNVPVGTYSIKTSYIGYRSSTTSNIRVNSQLTTEIHVDLSSEDVQVQAVEIVAERPLINKSATNAVRIIDADFFDNLPARGLDAAIVLQPGVVERDGNFYIRGGRPDETSFTLDGVGIKDIVNGGRSVNISAEAIEQVQVLTGGYTAEYGGASAGLVRSDLKTGSEQWKFTGLGETDNYSSLGKKALGGYSYGYSDATITAGGPIASQSLRFFGSAEFQKYGDPGTPLLQTNGSIQAVDIPRVWDGYDFVGVRMYPTVTPTHPNDYMTDTMNLVARPGNTMGGNDTRTSMSGTLSYALSELQVKASGSYSSNSGQFTTTTANLFNQDRLGKYDKADGFANLKATYWLSPKTSIEAAYSYTFSNEEQYDPAFGSGADKIKLYGDSAANAAKGYTLRSDGINFPAYQILLGNQTDAVGELPAFNQAGTVVQGYFKSKLIQSGLRADIFSQISKTVELKFGGEYSSATYRRFNPAGELTWVQNFKDSTLNPTDLSPTGKLAQRLRVYGPDNLGYDVFGNETSSDLKYEGATLDLGPRNPITGAGYLQSKIELQDIVLNLGLRYDYFSSDGIDWENPHSITFVDSLAAIQSTNFKKSPAHSYVSPRIGFSFPVTDQTVFHAQYGRFIQQPRLSESYRGTPLFYNIIKGGFFYQNPAAFGIEPEQTTSYELGFQQQVGENAALDVTAFYKDIVGQVTYVNMTSTSDVHGGYVAYVNGDFATTKGLEFKFTLRRTNRVQASINYTLSDARGTGSTPNALAGAWGSPLGGGVFTPKYIVPLSFNQAHRGSMSLDYRFAKNDGGPILEQMGLNILAQFNSGTSFTRLVFNTPDNATDPRFRAPVEEIGASTTPWYFQLDARLDKSFSLGPVVLNVYVYVINLLGTDNATDAFVRTGDPKNDGWLGTSEGRNKALTYGTDAGLYGQMYNTFIGGRNGATSNFGPPRQIRFGVKLEY
ncbi:MAG: TonB-dependent receptor [Ignavibacteriae bacterium]|nr:MAG: TonB-dependent receptor [Ignavibacteriota bacterium]